VSDYSAEMLAAISEIRDLVRLLAEPAVAERDKRFRDELRRNVGSSAANASAVLLMDGSRTQKEIHEATGINRGNLSTLIKRLGEAKLVVGEAKMPKLAIPIPSNFFDSGAENGKR